MAEVKAAAKKAASKAKSVKKEVKMEDVEMVKHLCSLSMSVTATASGKLVYIVMDNENGEKSFSTRKLNEALGRMGELVSSYC